MMRCAHVFGHTGLTLKETEARGGMVLRFQARCSIANGTVSPFCSLGGLKFNSCSLFVHQRFGTSTTRTKGVPSLLFVDFGVAYRASRHRFHVVSLLSKLHDGRASSGGSGSACRTQSIGRIRDKGAKKTTHGTGSLLWHSKMIGKCTGPHGLGGFDSQCAPQGCIIGNDVFACTEYSSSTKIRCQSGIQLMGGISYVWGEFQ